MPARFPYHHRVWVWTARDGSTPFTVTGTSNLTDLWYDDDVLVKFIVRDGNTAVTLWQKQ